MEFPHFAYAIVEIEKLYCSVLAILQKKLCQVSAVHLYVI